MFSAFEDCTCSGTHELFGAVPEALETGGRMHDALDEMTWMEFFKAGESV